MRQIDFFNFFRIVLEILVSVYATVVTLQWLYGWIGYLQGSDRYMSMIRRYLLIHGLRVRVKNFWGDVLMCALLTIVLMIIWHAHTLVAQLALVNHDNQTFHSR